MRKETDDQYKIGPRGHFCGGCNRQRFLHKGCIVDNSFSVSPEDPTAVTAKTARAARLRTEDIPGILLLNSVDADSDITI